MTSNIDPGLPTPNEQQVKQCYFWKLSLSQSRKTKHREAEDTTKNECEIRKPETLLRFTSQEPSASKTISQENSNVTVPQKPLIKIRSMSELMSPAKVVPETEESVGETTDNVDAEILVISSDEDVCEKTSKTIIKPKQISKPKAASTTRKRRSNKTKTETNIVDDDDQNPSKTPKEVKNIKTEIKKITVQRRLTKSTNLKRFSAKYLPSSQQKIDNYFKPMVNDENRNSVKYYETFDESKPKTEGITENHFTDYVEIVMQEMNRMKDMNPGISQPPLCITENDMSIDLTRNDTDCNFVSQISNKFNKSDSTSGVVCCGGSNSSISSHFVVKKKRHEKDIRDNYLLTNDKTEVPKNPSNYQSSSRRSSLIGNNVEKASTSEFDYKSIPSENTESVDYSPVGRPKRLKVAKNSVIATSVSTASEKEEILKDSGGKSNKVFAKSKGRKKLIFRTNTNVNNPVSASTESNPQLSTSTNKLNLSTLNKSLVVFDEIDLTTEKTPLSQRRVVNRNVLKSVTKILPSSSIMDNEVIKTPLLSSISKKSSKTTTRKRTRLQRISCPDYKIIAGTTFAVDAFRFGYIDGITHYFLTHYHADHYIGLKKSFTMPIYLSEITARLVLSMIGTSEEYLNVLHLNETIRINDIEITALDANHCPGAVMILFKLPSGECILHTGDFRASSQMESEPIFWNNSVHTIYLDTTYLSSKYAFKSQSESIDDAIECVREFREKHVGQRILIICGAYVIGKEKVWMGIAKEFNLNVWMDDNRKKAILAINDKEMIKCSNDNPFTSGIHILTMSKLTYDYLWQYLNKFGDYFDVLLALRPSGWEKGAKPQYRGKVNIVGIEYSEHSSFDELRRFIRFLQPIKIISTVPDGYDLSKTSKIPKSWYKNDLKSWQKSYQSSITNYLKFNGSTSSSSKCKGIKKDKQNKCEPEEVDGLILDATKSNLTLHTLSKSSLTPNKSSLYKFNSPQKTIKTIETDWLS